MDHLPQVIGTVVLLWILSSAWKFLRNYRITRASGLPTVLCPVDTNGFLWMVLTGAFQPQFEKYGGRLYLLFRRGIFGWEFREKVSNRKFSSPGFVLVTTALPEYWVEDVEVANAILTRWRDFQQSPVATRVLDLFGQNILISDGNDWQRQRRLISPVINEQISRLAWSHTRLKAIEMTKHYVETGDTRGTLDRLCQITFDVLCIVGFGIDKPIRPTEKSELKSGRSMSFIDAIHTVANNLVPAAILPTRILLLPFMPKALQKIGRAVKDFPVWTTEMLGEERAQLQIRETRNNIMSALIRASDEEGEQKAVLSESELQGNMFILTIAGFDTTANTLAYAFVSLAIDVELQQWIIEEIEQVAADADDANYDTIYPRLVRCRAFMHETLRHYTPLSHVMRATKSQQIVTTSEKTYVFAANSSVYVNSQAIHMSEAIWGSDAQEFRPSRWLQLDSEERPTIRKMPRGTFLAWSSGPRSCPGMKMSEVEFAAILYETFQRCRIQPVLRPGETIADARERLRLVMKDSQPQITLQMKKPETVLLHWIEKESK